MKLSWRNGSTSSKNAPGFSSKHGKTFDTLVACSSKNLQCKKGLCSTVTYHKQGSVMPCKNRFEKTNYKIIDVMHDFEIMCFADINNDGA